MIHFDWPWLLFLLPLPFLVRHFMQPATVAKEAALRTPFLDEFSTTAETGSGHIGRGWPVWFAILLMIFC